jgi:hypothetical protein
MRHRPAGHRNHRKYVPWQFGQHLDPAPEQVAQVHR